MKLSGFTFPWHVEREDVGPRLLFVIVLSVDGDNSTFVTLTGSQVGDNRPILVRRLFRSIPFVVFVVVGCKYIREAVLYVISQVNSFSNT